MCRSCTARSQGPQFVEQMATFPKVKFEYGPRGVKATSIRPGPNGKRFRRITEAVVPTLRLVANPRVAQYGMVELIGWTLPIDDTHYRIYVAGRVKEKGELAKFKSRYNGKTWAELSPEEHQKFPGDTEAQVGQGAITFHSEEHLMSSDQGVSMLRNLLRNQVDIVAKGGDPVGVAFDEAERLREVRRRAVPRRLAVVPTGARSAERRDLSPRQAAYRRTKVSRLAPRFGVAALETTS